MDARGPLLALDSHSAIPLLFCKLYFRANMRLDSWRLLIVLSQRRNPHAMPRSCHRTKQGGGGGGPSWLGMKGQMMPVHTARLHINLHLHFFFFKRTFVSQVICISIAQSSPPAAASSEDVRTRERHTGVRKKSAKIFRHIL